MARIICLVSLLLKMKKKALAIFDLDGTLTRRNSFLAFIRSTHSNGAIFGKTILLSPWLILFISGIYDAQKMKERVLAAFYKNRTKDSLEKAGNDFCEKTLPQILRNDVYQRMKWHQQQDHEVVMLSASCSIWLARWCWNENAKLIASKMAYEDGRATGKLEGNNCVGPEKKIRLLAEYDLSIFDRIYAYGNRRSDRHYIDLADEKYYVGSADMNWKTE
jgi:phosphatidylglycerophosphatase C